MATNDQKVITLEMLKAYHDKLVDDVYPNLLTVNDECFTDPVLSNSDSSAPNSQRFVTGEELYNYVNVSNFGGITWKGIIDVTHPNSGVTDNQLKTAQQYIDNIDTKYIKIKSGTAYLVGRSLGFAFSDDYGNEWIIIEKSKTNFTSATGNYILLKIGESTDVIWQKYMNGTEVANYLSDAVDSTTVNYAVATITDINGIF